MRASDARALPTRHKLGIVAALSFASGFPFGVLTELLPVWFTLQGMSLASIGVLTVLTQPYSFKPFWAPLVDRTGTRRGWIAATAASVAALIGLGAVSAGAGATGTFVWVAILALAFLSATQDISIDAYTIELMEERELGPANGMRTSAYRVALIVAGGLLVALSGTLGWPVVLAAAALLMLGVALLALRLPSTPRAPRGAGLAATFAEPLGALARRPAILLAVLFLFTFKFGDLALSPMVKPFWLRSGYTVAQVGWVQTSMGFVAAIAGALLGGWITARIGTFRALWTLGLVQSLSNLGYWAAAAAGAPRALMYGAAVTEQFTYGLGTAAFLTFMMSLCERRHAATQFALLSAVFAMSRLAAGGWSGRLAESMGFERYFLLTFLLSLPAFALLPWVRRALAPPDDEAARPAAGARAAPA